MPFIELNLGHFTYKDDFTIDEDGVPICKLGLRIHKDGYDAAKHRTKYQSPKSIRKHSYFCERPCSPTESGGRTSIEPIEKA